MNSQNITKEKKLLILEDILQHEEFAHSPKYHDLLRYLVHAEIDGKIIKESLLAVEFFNKDAIFDPSADSSVRAYMSNLRKKLDYYYLTEGKDRDIKIQIPKGHYHVIFTNNIGQQTSLKKAPGKRAFFFLLSLFSIILLSVLTVHFIIQRNRYHPIPKNNPIWNNFFSNTKRTLVVLGDYYFFAMPIYPDRQNYIRDIRINSDQELQSFLADHPQFKNKISETYHKYLDENVPWCLSYILPSLAIHRIPIDLKLASDIQLQDLQKFNIIYIGSYKNLHTLETVTRDLNFKYIIRNDERLLTFSNLDSNKVYTYSWMTHQITKARNDYPLVIKVTGQNNNTYLLFLSQHDFGNIATVKYFTDPDRLDEFCRRIPSKNFEALFEVTGIIRTDFSIKLINYNALYSDFQINLE